MQEKITRSVNSRPWKKIAEAAKSLKKFHWSIKWNRKFSISSKIQFVRRPIKKSWIKKKWNKLWNLNVQLKLKRKIAERKWKPEDREA